MPMLWVVFRAHVVRRVRGPCCGTCSGPMLWDVFGAYVVGRVRGRWCGTCSGPGFRDDVCQFSIRLKRNYVSGGLSCLAQVLSFGNRYLSYIKQRMPKWERRR